MLQRDGIYNFHSKYKINITVNDLIICCRITLSPYLDTNVPLNAKMEVLVSGTTNVLFRRLKFVSICMPTMKTKFQITTNAE